MSVDTKAVLRGGNIDVIQLANDLIALYGTDRNSVEVQFTFEPNFYKIIFSQRNKPDDISWAKWKEKNTRSMCVFYNIKEDYEDLTSEECTLLTLGAWGESVEIMESLLKKYTGWLCRNDCEEDNWEFIQG